MWPNFSLPSLHILLNLTLEILPLHQIRDIIVIVVRLASLRVRAILLLERLVRFCEFAEGGERVRAELVEDAGDEFCELFVFARAVDCEGVRGDGGVDCVEIISSVAPRAE